MIESFIRRRVLTTVLVLIAVILGGLSYAGLGVRRFPEIEFPFITVATVYEGASPAEIETEITKRIEDAVITISGIEEITSSSQRGLSLVFIEFGLDEDVDIKAVDVRNKIDQIGYLLPEEAEDPIPLKFEIGAFPILDLALYGPQDPNELFRLADEDIAPRLTQVPGVADVVLTGGQEREIHVLLDVRKLRKYRVPAGAVGAAVDAANVNVPAGHITQPGREFVVRTPGRIQRVEDILDIRVPTAGAGVLTVGNLGEVVDSYEDRRTASRFNGQDAIVLAVQARTDANEVEVTERVRAMLPELRRLLPEEARIEVARDTSIFITGALANVRSNMLLGIVLTAIVIFLFLKSLRATFIVAVVMPTAVVTAFVGMKASGFTLNIISLTGMAIVIGVLVNNAILILENVNRHIEQGLTPTEAAVAGTRGIALAIFSSTATNLVVFLPIAFMGEIIGRFFKELGLTVVFATVVSLAISFSLTPMMCGLLLKARDEGGGKPGFFSLNVDSTLGRISDLWRHAFERGKRLYLGVLDWCLAHRLATALVAALAFVASFGVFVIVGFEFFPPQDEGRFRITVEAPVGTPLEVTDAAVRQVEAQVRRMPHLENYTARVGTVAAGSTSRTEGVDLAEVSVTVVDRAEREEGLDELLNQLRPKLASTPSVRILTAKEAGGPQEAPISVEIAGDDMADLQRVAAEVKKLVESVPGTAGVTQSWQAGQPEVRVVPLQQEANRQGVNVRQLADEVRTYVEGRVASEFLDGDENYDIVVKLRELDRDWAADVERLFISSPLTGQMVRIGQVADVHLEAGSTLITRKDRARLVTVNSQLTGERPLGKVLGDVRALVRERVLLPRGVSIEYGGEAEMIRKNFGELFRAMATAAVLTFLCVAGIIESFGLAVIIIMALPVSLVGVSLAMLVANVTVNIFSLMAMVILVGMVVNNAIIVIDYAVRQEVAGKSPRQAIREACRERYRMILMANLTTVVALIPLSLGLGFAGEIFRPLAVVQMGGVVAAAVLSLLVIPAVYVMLRGRGKGG
ncbi:MAG: efflux RND transporter permease subunit [Planctomycetota bacterium]|jgi:HAE1 family hydrophobic/amphiphilic exporter-1